MILGGYYQNMSTSNMLQETKIVSDKRLGRWVRNYKLLSDDPYFYPQYSVVLFTCSC